MTNTQIRSYIVACESGRVREIADGLGLNPTSIIRSARSLERALRVPLFDRAANGPVPNRTGRLLAKEFGRAVREIELARDEVLLSFGCEGLEIVVGLAPMPGSHDLVRATDAFLSAFPDVRVRLVTGEYSKLIADLSNGHIDAMFGILRLPAWVNDLQEEILYRDSSSVVARAGHPVTLLDQVTPDDLARFKWLVPPSNTPRRNRIDTIFANLAKPPKFRLETASLSLSKAILLETDMITLLPRSEVKNEIDSGLLSAIPVLLFEQSQPKGLTTRAGWLPTSAHEAFFNCLREATSQSDVFYEAELSGPNQKLIRV